MIRIFFLLPFLLCAGLILPTVGQQVTIKPARPAVDTRIPKVWIFNGMPGDDEHHELYETNLGSLKKSFLDRFGVPVENITVLYGPKSAGYDGPCTREALLGELAKVVTHLQGEDPVPVWLIFEGHANSITGGSMYNLPGRDVSAREIGDALKAAPPKAPLVCLATTACSAAFMKPLSGPNRFIITATTAGDKENETEFPLALSQTLAADASDTNKDGILTVTELFQATTAKVTEIYNADRYILNEHPELDGDGDGKGTQRPSSFDATPAEAVGLKLVGGKKLFD
jgi:hypothetical protein